jgi:hypothetical protein
MHIDISSLNRCELEELLDDLTAEILARDYEIEALAGWSLTAEWARDAALVATGWKEVENW